MIERDDGHFDTSASTFREAYDAGYANTQFLVAMPGERELLLLGHDASATLRKGIEYLVGAEDLAEVVAAETLLG